MKKFAVVYMAHDGFASLYSGVGTIARDFLLSFPEVSKCLQAKHPDVELSLYVATMKLDKTSFALSSDIRDATIAIVNSIGRAHLIELNNNSNAQDAYGIFENWQFASVSGATFVYTIASQYDHVLVITVDTPFAQVANSCIGTYNLPNVDLIWLPQSTIRIHGYGMSSDTTQQSASYQSQRYEWEKGVIDLAACDQRVRIGCVGEFMRQHLTTEYGAEPNLLVNITNSLNLARLQQNIHTQEEIAGFLNQHHIPLDRPLLFSFGRAEPYKGLDLVLQNADSLIAQGYFVLIFAAPYTIHDPYLKKLDAIATKHPGNIAVFYGMDFAAPHYVMQWHNTRILAVLSRAEPFGIIPIESRFYNNPGLTLLVSNQGGLASQISDGEDGFITDLSPQSIHNKLAQIAGLRSKEKQRIAQKGHDKVIELYNQINVNINVLEPYVSRI